jgi:hypothetical protein
MGRPKTHKTTDFSGYWTVKTESSDYIVDFDSKMIKRLRHDANVLDNDGEWLKFAQIGIQLGSPADMIIVQGDESNKIFIYRKTSPVVKLVKLKTPENV